MQGGLTKLWGEWGRCRTNVGLENTGHKALPVCMGFLDLVPEGFLNEETQFTLRNGIVSSQLFPACDRFDGKQVDVHSGKISSRSERHVSVEDFWRSGRRRENTVSVCQLVSPHKEH